jgi:hypothetical protein
MSTPTQRAILQRVSYPRSGNGLQAVPVSALLGSRLGSAEGHVAAADLVIAVDVMTRVEILVFGQAALFPVEFGGACLSFQVLAVELDLDSDEMDALATLVEFVKGDHDLPWEVG